MYIIYILLIKKIIKFLIVFEKCKKCWANKNWRKFKETFGPRVNLVSGMGWINMLSNLELLSH